MFLTDAFVHERSVLSLPSLELVRVLLGGLLGTIASLRSIVQARTLPAALGTVGVGLVFAGYGPLAFTTIGHWHFLSA